MAANNELEIVIQARDAASAVLKQVQGQVTATGKSVTSSIGDTFRNNYAAAGVAAGGLIATIGLGTKAALDQASAYQQNRVAFETMLGSADRARILLKQVSEFAAATPFQLPEVVEGSKKLLAFGVAADEVIETFKMMGNIAAGVGTDKLPLLINVFGQVKSAGRLMTQDLLQFTSAGVPIIDLLAKHFGVATKEVRELVENGKVGFSDLKASLEQLGGPAGKWGDLMEKQSKTMSGTLSNVQDQLGRVLRQAVGIGPDGDIRKGSLFDVMTRGANAFLESINKVSPYLENFIGALEQNQFAVVALVGALAGLVVLAISAAVVFGGGVVLLLAFASAIGALFATIYYQVFTHWSQITGFFSDLGATIKGFFTNTLGLFRTGDYRGGMFGPWIQEDDKYVDLILDIRDTVVAVWSSITGAVSAAVNWWTSALGFMGNVFTTTFAAVAGALDYFRNHFLEVIGYAIGFAITLPIKLLAGFVYLSVMAMKIIGEWLGNMLFAFWSWVTGVVNYLGSIDWGRLFWRMGVAYINTLGSMAASFASTFMSIVNWVANINWAGIFAGIGRAMWNVGTEIINAITRAYNHVMGLNWGAIVGNIGRGLANAIIGLINGAIRGAFAGVPGVSAPQIPMFANGVRNFSGGLAIVGERGPELVSLPRGASVFSNEESRGMAGVTINQTNNIFNQFDLDEANARLAWGLANA